MTSLAWQAPGSRRPRADAAARDAAIGDIDWTVPAPGSVSSFFPAPSGELAVVSLGDRALPRVVLVPGVTGSKEDFVLMLPLLAEAGFHVQSLDLAGQYQSHAAGPDPGQPFTYDLFARDLIAFLQTGPPAHLLGYSFAGLVAQLVTVERPDLVRSLALLSTPPLPGNGFRGMKWLGPVTPFASGPVGAALMIWGIMTNRNRVPPGRLEFVRSRFALTDRRSVEDVVALMKRAPDLRAPLRPLEIPKLVAAGTRDLWPARLHGRLADAIGAELRVYRTGHSPSETAPHQLTADLLDLYARA
ncbi:alpha/beta fold hydrolase [Microbacterium rhizophilus]|uniref:alpha/beta fold hydrolase n=1 Tax=Microbacterium rhizophilus TaxID=3138934 RepID=UPI0031EF487E